MRNQFFNIFLKLGIVNIANKTKDINPLLLFTKNKGAYREPKIDTEIKRCCRIIFLF